MGAVGIGRNGQQLMIWLTFFCRLIAAAAGGVSKWSLEIVELDALPVRDHPWG